MFATLFLGVVLAVFLTLGAVSGDAERGLLQPLVVRPIGRPTLLLSRFVAAGAVCALYVLCVYFAGADHRAEGRWWPDRIATPGLLLAGAVIIMTRCPCSARCALATANGIALFMLFIAGLVAGLLGTIGHALNSHTIEHAAKIAAWVLPFEALYQDALQMITAARTGSPASCSGWGRSAARTCTAGRSACGRCSTSSSGHLLIMAAQKNELRLHRGLAHAPRDRQHAA